MTNIINKQNMVSFGLIALIATLSLMPLLIFGQTNTAPGPGETSVNDLSSVEGVLTDIMNWMFSIFLFIAVIMLLWSAFMYLTSRGDSEKTTDARKAFVWAIVAIIIAVLARSIPTIVAAFIGADVDV